MNNLVLLIACALTAILSIILGIIVRKHENKKTSGSLATVSLVSENLLAFLEQLVRNYSTLASDKPGNSKQTSVPTEKLIEDGCKMMKNEKYAII